MQGQDTIAAIATALSDAGLGIIRVSGDDAIRIVNQIFYTPGDRQILSTVESHTIHYGFIKDPLEKKIIDEVMVSVMKGPKSYTREDTVEISCHGGVLVTKKVLEAVLNCGARLSEPGEFTKRAFLNGRIDLSKAEAVMDLIHSQNEFAMRSSVSQLQGALFQRIKKLREEILYEIAFIESALDDPEHISLDGYTDKLLEKINRLKDQVQKLLDTADHGRLMKEGISTVIVGKPNAGKSSLLNLMVGEERSIVTDVAGTTRDVIRESIHLHGISLNIIDTAGIRNTEDVVEKIGVQRAKEYASNADLILYVVDSTIPLDETDEEILSIIQDKNVIILLNKSDLSTVVEESAMENLMEKVIPDRKNVQIVKTSTKDNTGIDIFEKTIKDMFFEGKISTDSEVVITNIRHKQALIETKKSLSMVEDSLNMGMPEDFYSIDLMSAYASLGSIIGEEVDDDLVNEIFSKFCMGK